MNLQVRSLSHTFPGSPPRQALDNLSFTVPSGQFVAVVGPSGCGKSTLLRLIADLIHPGSGSICLDGLSQTRPPPESGLPGWPNRPR